MHPDFTPVPNVFYDSCVFPNPEGTYAVCCLWDEVDRAASRHPEAYMVGPCGSTEGVDHIVRTLLANPQILRLEVCGANLTGTCEQLHETLNPGTGEAACLQAEGHLSPENDLIYDFPSNRRAEVRPAPAPDPGESPTGPGAPGLRFVGKTLWDVWPRLIGAVVEHGVVSDTSYGPQKELLAVAWVFGVAETLEGAPDWVHDVPGAGGMLTKVGLDAYAAGHFLGTADKPEGVSYTYADRLRTKWDDQIARIIERMKTKPEHRGGWGSTWDNGSPKAQGFDLRPSDAANKNPPCLTGIWFRRTGPPGAPTLFTDATFRSHDLPRAGVQNAWALCRLVEHVAGELGWAPGRLKITSLSGHAYSTSWAMARGIAKARGRKSFEDDSERAILRVRQHRRAAAGEHGTIAVDLLSPEGRVLKTLDAVGAEALERKVLAAGWVTTLSHAAWLGRELARAEA